MTVNQSGIYNIHFEALVSQGSSNITITINNTYVGPFQTNAQSFTTNGNNVQTQGFAQISLNAGMSIALTNGLGSSFTIGSLVGVIGSTTNSLLITKVG
ncbi:hypothetical protein ACLM2U_03050 [Bacillus pumilus]